MARRLYRLCLLITGVSWLLWLGLLTIAQWAVCEVSLPETWSVWLLQHCHYAHARCLECCEEAH